MEYAPQIILASTSPRRKEVMDTIGVPYTAISSSFEERHELHTDPAALVEDFSLKKAEEVLAVHPHAIVVGGDVIVLGPGGSLLGKPKDRSDALRMMQQVQHNRIHIYTGVAVISAKKRCIGHVKTVVHFKPMTEQNIHSYLDRPDADWMDKAGAFAVQGTAGEWIDHVDGEWEAIIGLSRVLTERFLREQGVLF